MKHCRVSAFARVARVIAYAAVALVGGAGSLLAQGSTGKIEGRVRDQAGAPIANAQVYVVGTAFNALTNPAGLLLHQQRSRQYGGGPRRLHRVQVDPGGRREGPGRSDDHRGRAAGADGGPAHGDHGRHPDPAAGAARRGHHEATDRRPVRRQPSGRPHQRRSCALQPGVTADNNGNLSIRGGRNNEAATYVDGVPVQAGYRGDRFAGAAATADQHRHQRLRRGLGHHRVLLGRVRQREVGHHLDRHQDRRQRLPGLVLLRVGRAVRRQPRRRASTGSRRASAGRWRAD